jgi:hypothetical protein
LVVSGLISHTDVFLSKYVSSSLTANSPTPALETMDSYETIEVEILLLQMK